MQRHVEINFRQHHHRTPGHFCPFPVPGQRPLNAYYIGMGHLFAVPSAALVSIDLWPHVSWPAHFYSSIAITTMGAVHCSHKTGIA